MPSSSPSVLRTAAVAFIFIGGGLAGTLLVSNAGWQIPVHAPVSGMVRLHDPPPPGVLQAHSVAGLPAPGPLADTNHYWDGSVYTGTATTATAVSVVETVPDDWPDASNFYYVIMSIWDNANSYDQIGYANDNGVWGLVYSWTTSCAGTYYYTADAMALNPGQTYLFTMAIQSGGNVLYSADNTTGAKAQLWSLLAPTGGTSFSVTKFFSACSNDYDYTDYEESYDSTQNVPSYDFFFTNNEVGGAGITAWTSFAAGTYPSGITVVNSGTNVTIENQPFTGGFTPPSATVEVGETHVYAGITVTALASSGTITLATASVPSGWKVTISPTSGVPTDTSVATITVPASPTLGVVDLQVTATNANALYTRFMMVFDVIPAITLGAPTVSPSSVDVGQSATFSDKAASGTGIYTYQWVGLPTGCASANTSSLLCVPTGPGSFNVDVNATDTGGFSIVSSSVGLTVDSDPTLTGPTAQPASIDSGQSTTFTTTTAGGAGKNTYQWFGLPSGCASSNALTLPCDPAAVGANSSFTIDATVTDANGFTTTSADLVFQIDGDPTVATPTANVSAVDSGQPVSFGVTFGGGSGGYTIVWSGLPAGCAATPVPLISCTPSAESANVTSNIVVAVTDSNGLTATSSALAFMVHPLVALSLKASSTSGNAPLSVMLTPGVVGGSGSYTFEWLLGDGTTSTQAAPTHAYGAPGTYTVSLVVVDALGGRASGTLTITALPPLSSLSVLPLSASLQTGDSAPFNATITCQGGACPGGVQYVWSLSNALGTLSSASGPDSTFTAGGQAGSVVLTVTATLNGVSKSVSISISITSRSSAQGLLGLPGYDGVGLLLAAAGAIIVIALLSRIVRRRRKSAAEVTPSWSPGPPTPAAPPGGYPPYPPPPP